MLQAISGFTVSLSISPKSRQLKPPSSQFFSLLPALNWNPDYFIKDSSQLDYPGSINLSALSGIDLCVTSRRQTRDFYQEMLYKGLSLEI